MPPLCLVIEEVPNKSKRLETLFLQSQVTLNISVTCDIDVKSNDNTNNHESWTEGPNHGE